MYIILSEADFLKILDKFKYDLWMILENYTSVIYLRK